MKPKQTFFDYRYYVAYDPTVVSAQKEGSPYNLVVLAKSEKKEDGRLIMSLKIKKKYCSNILLSIFIILKN
jgi:hypothetical protein